VALNTAVAPPPPPPITSIVLCPEFQLLGTVHAVPAVRNILLPPVAGLIVVASLEVSLPVFVSPPPDTVATLVTDDGALLATFTVSVIAGYAAPAASTSLRVQLGEPTPTSQFQPLPAMAVAVRPVGTVSSTVTAPLLGPEPTLLTVIV
jgi:hypothetical protein